MSYFHYEEFKRVLSVKDVSKILDVSVQTVYRLIKQGMLPAMKVSPRKTVIKAEELERYIGEK